MTTGLRQRQDDLAEDVAVGHGLEALRGLLHRQLAVDQRAARR